MFNSLKCAGLPIGVSQNLVYKDFRFCSNVVVFFATRNHRDSERAGA